jgi:hypothetical protein
LIDGARAWIARICKPAQCGYLAGFRCEFPLADGGPALDTDQTIWAFFMMQIL